MTRARYFHAAIVVLALATAVHVDWHVARPTVHHLSLGWRWHWLLAIPVFALSAWYVRRAWAANLIAASSIIVGAGILLGGVIEPAWELWVEGATLDWSFGPLRLAALGAFVATGAITHFAVVGGALRRRGLAGARR